MADTNAVLRYDDKSGSPAPSPGNTGATFIAPKSDGLSEPDAALTGPDGNLYVSSGFFGSGLRAILRYNSATGEPMPTTSGDGAIFGATAAVFAQESALTNSSSPLTIRTMLFGPNGNLYVAVGFDGKQSQGWVDRFDGTTGTYLGKFVTDDLSQNGGLEHPQGIVFGPDGKRDGKLDLYVATGPNSDVKQYDGTTGQFLGEFVASGSGGLDHAAGVTFGPGGNLYVASGGWGHNGDIDGLAAVLRYEGPTSPDHLTPGTFLGTFVQPGSGGLFTPLGLLFGPDGNLFVGTELYTGAFKAKADTSAILRYDGVAGSFLDAFVPFGSAGIENPGYMAFTETNSATLAFTAPKTAASNAVSLTTLARRSIGSDGPAAPVENGYQQINLSGFQPGMGRFTDPNLNGWGMDHTPDGPFAVANTSTGTITFYDAQGRPLPTVITVPAAPGQPVFPIGSPTGLVYNPTSDFVISALGKSAPATFLIDTLDGLICGWNPTVDPNNAIIIVDNSAEAPFAASYTGLTLGRDSLGQIILYAADSGGGPDISNDRIDMFDGQFHSRGSFTDPKVATQYPGNTVFQVENEEGKLFVTFAGFTPPFGGVVDIFDMDGHLLTPEHFAANAPGAGPLENPWGIVQAPSDFGRFSNDLLIGNVEGDGNINAFDPISGRFLGQLKHPDGTLIAITGLWDLEFGGGKPANGSTNNLYFDAGFNAADPAGNGLFGMIVAARKKPGDDGEGRDKGFKPDSIQIADGPGESTLTAARSIVTANSASGGVAGSGSSAGLGVGGGAYFAPGRLVYLYDARLLTLVGNRASTSNDDLFRDFTTCP
jgi:uncharacterized protein (TIGR03118 family)